jgi:hypothetical protein
MQRSTFDGIIALIFCDLSIVEILGKKEIEQVVQNGSD